MRENGPASAAVAEPEPEPEEMWAIEEYLQRNRREIDRRKS